MTINLTDVTFDLLVVEQLHDVVSCDYCSDTAHWTWRHGCGYIWVMCNGHRSEFDAHVASNGSDPSICKTCWTPVPKPLPWRAL